MSKFTLQGGVPANYVLGRGKIYLKGETGKTNNLNVPQSDTTQWRDIGNVTQFTISQESETKDHTSYLTGIQTIDKSIAVSNKMNISFATDELSVQNLAMFFGGDIISTPNGGSIANAARIDSDDAVFFAGTQNMFLTVPTLTTNHFYDTWIDMELTIAAIGAPLGGVVVRAYDFEAAGTQTITVRKNPTNRTTADGTLLTEGTHYVIDRKVGMIKFLTAAGLASGDTLQIKWDDGSGIGGGVGADPSLHMISMLANSGKTVSLKFVQENPNDDDNIAELVLFQVKLKPEGDYSGIGDDWASVAFTGVAEALTENIPFGASPYGRFTVRDSYST